MAAEIVRVANAANRVSEHYFASLGALRNPRNCAARLLGVEANH